MVAITFLGPFHFNCGLASSVQTKRNKDQISASDCDGRNVHSKHGTVVLHPVCGRVASGDSLAAALLLLAEATVVSVWVTERTWASPAPDGWLVNQTPHSSFCGV